MSRCLRDHELLSLCEGEGSHTQWDHLKICSRCARSYQQLAQDLEKIGRVLQAAPPVIEFPYRSSSFRFRWMPVAAALTVAVAFFSGKLWLQQPPESRPKEAARQTEVLQFLEEDVAPALFASLDARESAVPTPVSDLAYLQAALEGDWPCEQKETFPHSQCELHPFPLLTRGQ